MIEDGNFSNIGSANSEVKYNVRKYGFHGILYSYVLKKYECMTESQTPNVILCHLSGGSSICAVKNGKSYDTTMGLTPNSGLLMS